MSTIDPRRIGSKLGLLAAVAMFVLLLPGIAQAYTCTNMVASQYVDAKGPPFSPSMDDMINYIAVTYPAVAANPNKLSALGYLTGVYCGEPGHVQDPLYAVIDDKELDDYRRFTSKIFSEVIALINSQNVQIMVAALGDR